MSVCCECCVLSGKGLCDELITRPGEFYRMWCVIVCDLETSWMRRPWPTGGCCTKINKQTFSNNAVRVCTITLPSRLPSLYAWHAHNKRPLNVFNTTLVANETHILTYHSLHYNQLVELED